jgi:hypothetical protein
VHHYIALWDVLGEEKMWRDAVRRQEGGGKEETRKRGSENVACVRVKAG